MMKTFSKITRKKYRLESGFSMLEAVVVVGVLLALAVAGFFSYGAITDNAKRAKVASTASDVLTAVTVASLDGTDPEDVTSAWNSSTNAIRVELEPTSAPSENRCVIAYWVEAPTIKAQQGKCAAEPTPEPTVEEPSGEQVVHYMIAHIWFPDPNHPVGDVRLTVVNRGTGKTVYDQTTSRDVGGFDVYDMVTHPASDPIPSYLFTFTSEGKTYTDVVGGAVGPYSAGDGVYYDAGDWDGKQGYVAEYGRGFDGGRLLRYGEK